MNTIMDTPAGARPQANRTLRWLLGSVAAVVVVFVSYQLLGDRKARSIVESQPQFAAPTFAIRFSKHTAYDPLSFVGRGARAGLWKWTPEGLELSPQGRTQFREEGEQFAGEIRAGERRVSKVLKFSEEEGVLAIDFLYEWKTIDPAAAALLNPAPEMGRDYPGQLRGRAGAGYQVDSVETPDYDQPLARLQAVSSGQLK
jgi:hypothetical protein